MRLRLDGAAVLVFGCLGGGLGLLTACPHGGGLPPRPPTAAGWGLGAEVLGADTVHGVAMVGDPGGDVIVAAGVRAQRASRGGTVAWTRPLGAAVGALALAGELAVVAVGGREGTVPGLDGGLRGEPGAALVALAADDGTVRWTVGAGSTRWTVVSAISGAGDGFLVTGSFAGTLRVGDRTVTAAGGSDGFVAAIDRAGAVRWLRRMGGDGADAIAAAATLGGGRVAIAGTFSGTAELGDSELVGVAERTLAADGFVAVLEADGRPVWTRVYGGAREDTCAGVAVLAGGAIAVAGTVRGEVDVAGRRLEARGAADGLVAVFAADASVTSAWLIGGDDFDAITAIGGSGDRLAVAGWWTGTLASGERADGVDDVFVATADAAGATVIHAVQSAGPASATALTVTAAGWLVAVHAAQPTATGGDQRPAGAALWFRGF